MRWVIALTVFLLTGCATYYDGGGVAAYTGPRATSIDQVDIMVGAQQPVEYRVGFQAGCDSGYVSAGNTAYTFTKDVERYDVDSLYRQGWDDGHNRCRENPALYPAASYDLSYYYGASYYYRTVPSWYWSPSFYYSSGYYYPYQPYYSSKHKHYKRHHYGHHSSSRHYKALDSAPFSSSSNYKATHPKSSRGSGQLRFQRDHVQSKGSHQKSRGSSKRTWQRLK